MNIKFNNGYIIGIIVILIIILYLYYYRWKDIKQNYIEWKYPIKTFSIKTDLTHFKKKQKIVDSFIDRLINDEINNDKLQKLANYSLTGGKRVRPVIMLSIFEKLNNCNNNVVPQYLSDAIICIEIIHSTSLILDDIMDNDTDRRGKQCFHTKYGETYALIVSIYLASLAFQKMCNSVENMLENKKDNKNMAFIFGYISNKLKELSFGQFLDISMPQHLYDIGDNIKCAIKEDKIKLDVKDLIHKKTSSLFELCFVWPWIMTHPYDTDTYTDHTIINLEKAAKLFGLLFQISDDFEDVIRDMRRDGKNSVMNYVINKGLEKAYEDYASYRSDFIKLSKSLNIYTIEIKEIVNFLSKRVEVYYNYHKNNRLL